MAEQLASTRCTAPPGRAAAPILHSLPVCLVVLGFVAFVWVRFSVFTGEFGNNDVAGIAYEADTLLRGDLPYRDTLQLKPPGTFFVFAAVFGLVGRDLGALRVVLSLWLLVGAVGIHWSAQVLYGSRLSAALATAIYLVSVGAFDLNYSSWMGPAYVWAVAALLIGLSTGSGRWHFSAGVLSALAFLFKQPAAVLAPLALVLWLHARRGRAPGATSRAFVGWAAGALVAAIPLTLFYASRGALSELFRSVFAWGFYKEHVSTGGPTGPGLPGLASIVLSQLFDLFPLATGLFVLTLAGVLWRRRRSLPSSPLLPSFAFLVFSLLGGAMSGARFYEHYAIQYLPALALLAAHPSGILGLIGLRGDDVPRRARWAATVLSGILCLLQGRQIVAEPGRTFDYRPPLLADGASAARRAGEHIRARTRPEETIYAWGWLAWPVYFWADRRAPLKAYREMGTVTTVNTNTGWSASQPFKFRPGPAADELVRAFDARRPAYFVYSPYYVWQSGGPEPLLEFDALQTVLRRDYELEATYGNLLVYARKHTGG